MTLEALSGRWRDEAAVLRRRGAEAQAAVLEQCAAELADARALEASQGLTIAEAARECGYSTSQLRRIFPGQNRVARADLPRKGRRVHSPAKAVVARLIASRGGSSSA